MERIQADVYEEVWQGCFKNKESVAMKVIKIQPRDMYITFEISLTSAENLVHALDKAVIDAKTDKEKAGMAYLQEVFFPGLNEVVEDFEDNKG